MNDESDAERSSPEAKKPESFGRLPFFKNVLHRRFHNDTASTQGNSHVINSWKSNSSLIFLIIISIFIISYSIFQYFIGKNQLDMVRSQLEAMNIASEQTDEIVRALREDVEAAKISAATAQQTLVANQRAWVGPTDVSIAAPLEKNRPFAISIRYLNTGREPAFDLLTFHGNWLSSATEWTNGAAAKKISDLKDKCLATLPTIAGTQVAYPTTGANSYSLTIRSDEPKETNNIVFTDRLSDGDDVFVIQGCFIYRSVNTVHHSAFCHYYQARNTPLPALSICAIGNAAD